MSLLEDVRSITHTGGTIPRIEGISFSFFFSFFFSYFSPSLRNSIIDGFRYANSRNRGSMYKSFPTRNYSPYYLRDEVKLKVSTLRIWIYTIWNMDA